MDRDALLAASVQPGGREPAPGALALAQAFVNTVDAEHGPDLLDRAADFEAWLARHVGASGGVRDGDLAAARELREALRGMLLANNGAVEPPGARAVLEAAGRRAGLAVGFDGARPALVPDAGGVDGALGRVVAVAFAAMLDGSWPRLKACPAERCGWAFYDRSSNASATWCSMTICGSRAKAGAYYRRRRAQDAAQAERQRASSRRAGFGCERVERWSGAPPSAPPS
jgi:predicted RNA-binding Zn ribbon-like protein